MNTNIISTRRQALDSELKRITAVIKRDYDPEKIIVFGSFVSGKTHEWSDLDIVVIKKTRERFIERLKRVTLLTDPTVATDFVVYTPKEFSEMAKDNYFVRDEIVNKGKIIYDRNRFS